MTADQFIWWLRGYLDSLGDETAEMPRADARAIRNGLERVGPPAVILPIPRPAPPSSVLDKMNAIRCHRCGQLNAPGRSHFCNGAMVNG